MASNVIPLAITTGAAAVIGGTLVWKISGEYAKLDQTKERELKEVVKDLCIEDIAALLKSSDLKVRNSAQHMLVERAARRNNLTHILQLCLSDDLPTVAKAVTVVYLMVKHSDYTKTKLIECNVQDVLPKVIANISNDFDYNYLVEHCRRDDIAEKVLRRTIASVFYLSLHAPSFMVAFNRQSECIKHILINVLGEHSHHVSMEVKRWSTYLLHQMAQRDMHGIKASLKKWGIIRKSTRCLIKTLGDVLQTQLCLQILVHYLNDAVEEMMKVCKEMATLGILPHLVGLLRSDEDENVVQLSAILIHHFCCFDIDIVQLSNIPGIVKILYAVLNATDYGTQKTVIRICNYLAVGSVKFRKAVLNYKPLLKKLSVCMLSSNTDVMSGTLMFIHDLAMPDKKSIEKLININPDIIKSLVQLSANSKNETAQLIAETLGYICSCETLHELILKYGVVNTILHFAKNEDVGVQFWASALLLNLSMISDKVKESIIRNGGINVLLEMAVSGDEVDLPDIATNATKCLVILCFLDSSVSVKLTSGLESSIVIDGTERCPGKQGINVVSLDVVKYRYSKGQVFDPEDPKALFALVSNSHSEKLGECYFVVTQGDCTVLLDKGLSPPVELAQVTNNSELVYEPAWTWVYTPQKSWTRTGTENIEMEVFISLAEQISQILREQFTLPLIDVLLAVPTSTLCKTEELKLVEILSRHHFQRKAMVSSGGFLEYLYELIWLVAELKDTSYFSENHTKISHCTIALKILQLFSIDASSASDLVSRGALRALVALMMTPLPSLVTKTEKMTSGEEKPAWFCGFNDINQSPFDEKEDDAGNENDDLFLPLEELEPPKKRTVTYCEDVKEEVSERRVSRLRSDSYILRSDSRYMEPTRSFIEQNDADMEQVRQHGRTFSISADHQQIRRISRTLSVSLQQSKSSECNSDVSTVAEFSRTAVKEVMMIVYYLTKNGDKSICKEVCNSNIVPLLMSMLGCFNGNIQRRMSLIVGATIVRLNTVLGEQTRTESESVRVEHVDRERRVVIGCDGLSVTNENWFFETVVANQHVCIDLYENSTPSGWYYEVTVHTDGIMQIGWVYEDCEFCPEKGIGVGDNDRSLGFDGARQKIWHGPSHSGASIEYGVGEWQSGDVVSVLLSWQGNVSFWLNGKDMGVATVVLDTKRNLLPAVSYSSHQHCSFAFAQHNFRYDIPSGFESIEQVHEMKLEKKELIQPIKSFVYPPQIQGPCWLSLYFEVSLPRRCTEKQFALGFITRTRLETRTMACSGGVFGCGVLLPLGSLVYTRDGVLVSMETPIQPVTRDSLLNMIPYVSVPECRLNMGASDFMYKDSNSMVYKHALVEGVHAIMEILALA